MTVRIVSKDPGHDALKLLARWIAEAYLEELAQERLKELAEKNTAQNTIELKSEEEKKDNGNQGCVRNNQAATVGKNPAGHKKGNQ